jgi:hypothetical protein
LKTKNKPFRRKSGKMSLGGWPPGHVYGEGGLDRIGCGRGGPSAIECRCRGRGSCRRVRDVRGVKRREDVRVLEGILHMKVKAKARGDTLEHIFESFTITSNCPLNPSICYMSRHCHTSMSYPQCNLNSVQGFP